MARALIAYDSSDGNTRRAAEEIARGVAASGMVGTTVLADVHRLTPARLEGFDILLIGSPNHRGNASNAVQEFIHRLGPDTLRGKRISVFDTCNADQTGLVARQIHTALCREDPNAFLPLSGLSLVVEGRKGPLRLGELGRCWQYGQRVAGVR